MEGDKIVKAAKSSLEEAERWHKRINLREIVFGFNDGSISTLAILAGVTGAALARSEVLIAVLSGVVGGAVSMGIGAYISSKSEIEHHRSEIRREEREIESVPEIEREEIRQIYGEKAGFTGEELDLIVGRITSDKKTWLDVMMKEELGLFEERFENPVKLGLIMLLAFIAGGVIPIAPFLLASSPLTGLIYASLLTFTSLFLIGVWKTRFTERSWLISGGEMVGIGVLATVVPYLIGDVLIRWVLRIIL